MKTVLVYSLFVSFVIAKPTRADPTDYFFIAPIDKVIEEVIDTYYKSDERIYSVVSFRLFECALLYQRSDNGRIPRKVKRDRGNYSKRMKEISKVLHNDPETWKLDIESRRTTIERKLHLEMRYSLHAIYNCNMFLEASKTKDAVYELMNPDPFFDQE